MSAKIPWSPAMDATVTTMRAAGSTWRAIGIVLDVSEFVAWKRGHTLGMDTAPIRPELVPVTRNPEPLPAGHPASWAAITAGTSLAGVPYRAADAGGSAHG